MKIRSLTIRARLAALVGLALLGMLALGWSAERVLNMSTGVCQVVKDRKLGFAIAIEKMNALAREMVSILDSSAKEGTDQGIAAARSRKDGLYARIHDADELTGAPEFKAKLAELKLQSDQLLDIGAKRIKFVINQDFTEIPKLAAQYNEMSGKYLALLAGLQEAARADLESSLSSVLSVSKKASRMGMWMTAAFVIFVAVLSIWVIKSINKSISRTARTLDEMTELLLANSKQVSNASQNLAESASRQAASIEETSASIEEISSMTRQNASNSKQASDTITGAMNVVSLAGKTMLSLTSSMGEISRASEETSKIIKTIDEIAFQTNLLALNAAVEAARAGDAGAGFAVVADEVRNLALRAAEAARNTADLLEGAVKGVREGADLVEKTRKEFDDVASSVKNCAVLVTEISTASREQAQGIEQISKAVLRMDKDVQQNSAMSEETASCSEEMSNHAGKMQLNVAELKALIGKYETIRSGQSKEIGKI